MFCQMSLSKVSSAEFSPIIMGPLPRFGEGIKNAGFFHCHCLMRSRRMIAVTSRRVPVLEATSGVSGGLVTSLQQGSSASGARR